MTGGWRTTYRGAASVAREVDLIARIGEGDRRAFEELYNLYHRRMARFLTRLTRRYDIAEEVINDTFWVVWRNARKFRGESHPRPGFWASPTARPATRSAPPRAWRRRTWRSPPSHSRPRRRRGPKNCVTGSDRPWRRCPRAAPRRRAVLRARVFLRRDRRDHELPGKYRENATVPCPREAAEDAAAARRADAPALTAAG